MKRVLSAILTWFGSDDYKSPCNSVFKYHLHIFINIHGYSSSSSVLCAAGFPLWDVKSDNYRLIAAFSVYHKMLKRMRALLTGRKEKSHPMRVLISTLRLTYGGPGASSRMQKAQHKCISHGTAEVRDNRRWPLDNDDNVHTTHLHNVVWHVFSSRNRAREAAFDSGANSAVYSFYFLQQLPIAIFLQTLFKLQ